MTNPLYDYGDVVYFRESAALGFIEASKISGVHRTQNGWIYSLNTRLTPMSGGVERRSQIGTQQLMYSEDELVTKCEAFRLAEANAERVLNSLRTQRIALCGDSTESG